ncbi:unnamed protein product [Lactuca virosa]|uniref:Uncharacterized protein n=1 Tax=Lactuca virosa TaxID=75947 RepID=A0AAU9LKL1_9ASTR|nr:unnamed protein product [Lactuca virosa]
MAPFYPNSEPYSDLFVTYSSQKDASSRPGALSLCKNCFRWYKCICCSNRYDHQVASSPVSVLFNPNFFNSFLLLDKLLTGRVEKSARAPLTDFRVSIAILVNKLTRFTVSALKSSIQLQQHLLKFIMCGTTFVSRLRACYLLCKKINFYKVQVLTFEYFELEGNRFVSIDALLQEMSFKEHHSTAVSRKERRYFKSTRNKRILLSNNCLYLIFVLPWLRLFLKSVGPHIWHLEGCKWECSLLSQGVKSVDRDWKVRKFITHTSEFVGLHTGWFNSISRTMLSLLENKLNNKY